MVFFKKKSSVKKMNKPYKKRIRSKSNRISTIKKVVRNILSKKLETKVSVYSVTQSLYGGNQNTNVTTPQLFNNGCNWPLSPYPPLAGYVGSCTISQGTGQDNRIGNRVNTKSLYMRYVITPQLYSAVYNTAPFPGEFIMWIYRNKSQPDLLNSQITTGLTDFFQAGSITEGFQGNLTDINRPINKDNYTLLKKIRHKVGYSIVSVTGATSSAEYYANNDFKLNIVRTLNLTKLCPKIVQYNDNSIYPTSHLLQCVCEFVPADGSKLGPTSANTTAVIFYELEYRYTDS